MPLVKEIVFSPLYILASFVKLSNHEVSIGAWIYLWAISRLALEEIYPQTKVKWFPSATEVQEKKSLLPLPFGEGLLLTQ